MGRAPSGSNSSTAVDGRWSGPRREVVLCGGAINSPQLLMLSGIGDREQLAEHGIDVVQHAPQVGKNLADHLCVPLGFDVEHDTLFAAEKPLQLRQLPDPSPRHAHLQRRRSVRVRAQPPGPGSCPTWS